MKNDVQMLKRGWDDRAWRVLEGRFLHLPDKGFWHL